MAHYNPVEAALRAFQLTDNILEARRQREEQRKRKAAEAVQAYIEANAYDTDGRFAGPAAAFAGDNLFKFNAFLRQNPDVGKELGVFASEELPDDQRDDPRVVEELAPAPDGGLTFIVSRPRSKRKGPLTVGGTSSPDDIVQTYSPDQVADMMTGFVAANAPDLALRLRALQRQQQMGAVAKGVFQDLASVLSPSSPQAAMGGVSPSTPVAVPPPSSPPPQQQPLDGDNPIEVGTAPPPAPAEATPIEPSPAQRRDQLVQQLEKYRSLDRRYGGFGPKVREAKAELDRFDTDLRAQAVRILREQNKPINPQTIEEQTTTLLTAPAEQQAPPPPQADTVPRADTTPPAREAKAALRKGVNERLRADGVRQRVPPKLVNGLSRLVELNPAYLPTAINVLASAVKTSGPKFDAVVVNDRLVFYDKKGRAFVGLDLSDRATDDKRLKALTGRTQFVSKLLDELGYEKQTPARSWAFPSVMTTLAKGRVNLEQTPVQTIALALRAADTIRTDFFPDKKYKDMPLDLSPFIQAVQLGWVDNDILQAAPTAEEFNKYFRDLGVSPAAVSERMLDLAIAIRNRNPDIQPERAAALAKQAMLSDPKLFADPTRPLSEILMELSRAQ